MKRFLRWAPALALLAACSGSAVSLQPGQWETTIRFTAIDVPGAPEAQLTAARQLMTQPNVHSGCITPEETANPASTLLSPDSVSGSCQFSENTFSGGIIRVRGTCQPPDGTSTQMEMDGTYTATAIETRLTSRITAPPGVSGPPSMTLTGTLTGRRTGDCAR